MKTFVVRPAATSLGRADGLRALLGLGRGGRLRALGVGAAGRAAHGSVRARLLVVADAVGLLPRPRETDVAGRGDDRLRRDLRDVAAGDLRRLRAGVALRRDRGG